MGRVARAKTGLHHGGGHIPIGYEYEDGHLVINPYEAEQVRKIYEWYLAGDSLKTITDKLQEAGYTNKYSSYNSWTSVRNILGNETYTGRLHFGDVIVDNAHEPIISKEQFDAAQVLRDRRVDVDASLAAGADADLFHVHVRRMEEAAFRRNGQHCDGAVLPFGDEVRPFHRVYGDIHFFAACAYVLADIEHRRFVHLPFADDDGAGNGRERELGMHPVYGELVRSFLIAPAHETAAADRRLFCDAHKFQR